MGKKYIETNRSMKDITKPVRVYYNGKRTANVYLSGNWITRSFAVVKREVKYFSKVALIVTAVYGVVMGYNWYKAPAVAEAKAQTIATDTLKTKVEAMKWEVVDTIETCEKGQYGENDGIILYDPLISNPKSTAKKNVPSIGVMMWKQSTIVGYVKSLRNVTINMKEAALIALDRSEARQLAYEVIFKTDNGYKNWLNCSNKHSIGTKVAIIKQLEK